MWCEDEGEGQGGVRREGGRGMGEGDVEVGVGKWELWCVSVKGTNSYVNEIPH